MRARSLWHDDDNGGDIHDHEHYHRAIYYHKHPHDHDPDHRLHYDSPHHNGVLDYNDTDHHDPADHGDDRPRINDDSPTGYNPDIDYDDSAAAYVADYFSPRHIDVDDRTGTRADYEAARDTTLDAHPYRHRD